MVLLRKFFLVFPLVIVSQFAFAHGNLVQGHISDSLSTMPLVGAAIFLNTNEQFTSTDQLGNFRFDGLKDGKYFLTISFLGYRTQTIEVTVSSNESKSVRVALLPSSLNLQEVIFVSPTDANHAMTQINKIDISFRPLKSSQDILRMIPGLVTAQHAGGGKAEQIFLRGFDIDHGTDITLTVDGMPVNMVSHAHGQGYADLHFLTPEIIDHVDFNKGPYYSSIGDFNTAGYANFRTLNSLDKSSLKLEAGRFDTYRAVGLFDVLSDPVKNQHAYLAAEYQFTNGPFQSPQNFNRINLLGKFSGRIDENRFFTASLSTFKSEWDASGQIPARAVSSGYISRFGSIDNTEGGSTGRTNANFSLIKFLENGASVKNQFYVSHYDFELYSNFTFFLHDSINGDAIRQKERRTIYGYNASAQKEIFVADHAIQAEAGVGIRYDDISNNELSHVKARHNFINSISLGDVDQINANAYADLNINISRKISANAGIRTDVFSYQYADQLDSLYRRQTAQAAIVSPKLSFFYNASAELQVYVKSGFGFHSNDTRVIVDQQARQTLPKAFGTDLGIFAKPFSNLVLNLAFWQLNLQQEFVYVGDESVVEASGETQRYGLDLSIRYQPAARIFIDFDSNYSHGRSVTSPEGENHIPLAPTFTSIGGITMKARNGIHGSLRYRLIADRPANEDNSVTAKGYFLLEGAVGLSRPGYEIMITGTNLLNREWNEAQFDTLTRLPGEVSGISELTFTPGDPIFIKAAVTFFF